MNNDTIYFDFFIENMHFTCEHYGDNAYGIYYEGMLVDSIDECNYDKAEACAYDYYNQCVAMGVII